MTPEILHTRSFVSDAVALITGEAEKSIAARGIFRIALSGGNTPRPVYEGLAGLDLPWDKWEITFGDERCVPPESDQSNFRMARLAWFDPARVPTSSILRMEGESDPVAAAEKYEKELLARSTPYRHDLVLLGMGDDGHTASLFPGTEALGVTNRLVVANYVPKFSTHRLTFTYPLLDAARHVCFLVSSPGKEQVLKEVLAGNTGYPSAAVAPVDGRITWLLGGGA
ncbi:MAG: 6-phosphogluconolactonase [Verrucomicrobiota bacterium]